MERREKVEQGLKACTEMVCPDECPYKRDGDPNYCQHRLHRDALEELQEEPYMIIYGESIADKIMKWTTILGAWTLTVLIILKLLGKL